MLGMPFLTPKDQQPNLWYLLNTPLREGVTMTVVHQREAFTRGTTGRTLTISDGFDAMVLAYYLINGDEPAKCLGLWRFANEDMYTFPVNFCYEEKPSTRHHTKAGAGPKAAILTCLT